ncbi:MAG: hypothetical protein ACOVP4_02270 [Bacteriovoracaceae bacterium]
MKCFVFIITLSFFSFCSVARTDDSILDVTLQAGVDYRMSPTQLSVMFWPNPTNQIGLKAGVDREGDERQTNVSLISKHFLKNSFYVSPEIFYLNTREKESWWFADALFDQKATYAEYVSLGAGVRIGNQWVIKHFTLGLDWIGFGRRFGTFRKESKNSAVTTYTLFNIYAGISF